MFQTFWGLIGFVIIALCFSMAIKRVDLYLYYKKDTKKDKS